MDVDIVRGDKKRGPVSRDAVVAWARSGLLKADDLVWAPGMSAWTKAKAVPFLAGFYTGAEPELSMFSPSKISIPLVTPPTKYYYVARGEKSVGPFSEEQMQNYIAAHKLVPEDKVYDTAAARWVTAAGLWSFPAPAAAATLAQSFTPVQPMPPEPIAVTEPYAVKAAEMAEMAAYVPMEQAVVAESRHHATISEVVGESEESDRDGLHFLLAIALSLLIHSTLLMASILNPPKMPVDLIEEQAMVAAALVIKEPPKEEAKVETNAEEIKVVTGGSKGGGGGGKSTGGGRGGSDFSSRGLLALVGSAGEGDLTDWANSGGSIDSMVGNFGGIALSGESTSGRGIGQGAGFGGGGLSDLLAGGGDTGMPSTSDLSRSAHVRAEMPGVSGVGSASGNRDPKAIYRVVSSYDSAFKARYVFYLKTNPKLGGRVVISFTIAPDGSVTRASVISNTTGNPTLGNDITNIIRRMNFGAIDRGDVTVQYPFTFETGV